MNTKLAVVPPEAQTLFWDWKCQHDKERTSLWSARTWAG